MKCIVLILFAAFSALAQKNDPASTNAPALAGSNSPPGSLERVEQIRAECLQGRRIICGQILKVLPGGLVVDSGYTDLLRPPLNQSWLIPGRVVASRPAGLVESCEPESICVGVVFLTDLPRLRGAKPRPYDYVTLLAYPTGQFTFTSVGTVQKTVRRFSGTLLKAVDWNLQASQPSASTPP